MTSSLQQSLPRSIPQLLFNASVQHAGRTAIEEHGQCIDYSELPRLALGVTRSLMAQGIGKGDRVAIWAPNGRDWIIAALGIHCAGAVMVPINTRMKGPEAADILLRSGSRLLFVQPSFLGTDYLALLAPYRPASLKCLVLLGETTAASSAGLDWDGFVAIGAATSESAALLRAASVNSDDLSDLLFTSGTTGKPKGVMSAHGQTIRAFSEYVSVIGLQAGDRYLVINPFFHAFGYKAGWLTCLLAGATILPHPVFDAEAVFQRIAAERRVNLA
ncbi:MAG: AMP-binding protein, partial [Pseudomonas sp.]|nr:AMP-binding protein [Pseudomonas sp.]